MSAVLHMAAAGLCTPLGFGLEASAAAMRAGLDRIDELPWVDDDGEPILGSAMPELGETPLEERLVAMLAAVLAESAQRWQVPTIERCIVAWPGRFAAGPGRFAAGPGRFAAGPGRFAAGPERFVGPKSDPELAAELSRRSGVGLGRLTRVFGDEAAGPKALALAAAELQAPASGLQRCLVCGVDSLLDLGTLAELARHARLRTLDESDGLCPGEAAAAVWVSARPLYRGGPRVLGMGAATEPARLLDDTPLLARGMSAAIRQALAQAGLEAQDGQDGLVSIDYLLSDLGGEAYHFLEHALAHARLHADHPELWHLSEFLGSHGAAASPVAWAVSELASRQGWSPGRRVLCTASGLGGERAALILQHPPAIADEAIELHPAGTFAL